MPYAHRHFAKTFKTMKNTLKNSNANLVEFFDYSKQ